MPEILFTGTNLEYARRMIQLFGQYRQESDKPSYLSPYVLIAFDAAINRSHKHKGTPILLVVNGRAEKLALRWNERIGFQDDILADTIPLDAILGVYQLEYTKRTGLIFADNPVQTLRDEFQVVTLI